MPNEGNEIGWNLFKKIRYRREDYLLPDGLWTPVFVPRSELVEVKSYYQLWKYAGAVIGSFSMNDWENLSFGQYQPFRIQEVYEVSFNGSLIYRAGYKDILLLRR